MKLPSAPIAGKDLTTIFQKANACRAAVLVTVFSAVVLSKKYAVFAVIATT